MLTFKFIFDAAKCAHYFEDGDLDDYYSKDQRGTWTGKGAEVLGLNGHVESEQFKHLLNGRSIDGSQQLRKIVPSKKNKRRLGIDFTYSAPKSVTIQALVSGDKRVLEAHDKAVAVASAAMEKFALALKSEKSIRFRQRTGNLIFANFGHELSRDQDPQLHTHVVTMNMTQREDGAWVALTNDLILKNTLVLGAIYRGELAAQLEALGYNLRKTRTAFELAHITDQMIDGFSKRSKDIEKVLHKRGMSRETASTAVKQGITMSTRKEKAPTNKDELRESWIKTLNELGTDVDRTFKTPTANELNENRPGASSATTKQTRADRAVEFAVAHLSERQGIFTYGELYETATNAALSAYSEVEAAIGRATSTGDLVQEIKLYQSAKSFRKEAQKSGEFQASAFMVNQEGNKLSRQSWIAIAKETHGMTLEDATRHVDDSIRAGRLVEAEVRYTTNQAMQTEQTVLNLEKAGRGMVLPVMTAEMAKELLEKTDLNQGQKDAASIILTSNNRFCGIQGYAGTGKSHALSATVKVLEQSLQHAKDQKFEIIGIAPYASQNKALALLGMQSQTLASFLARTTDQEKLHGHTIVLLDESSVIPAQQMKQIMEIVEARGARLVLIGDKKQTQAVESGKPFEQLQDGGMQMAHITEIVRQKDAVLKKAVELAAQDRVGESLETLQKFIKEIPNEDKRHQLIAKDYVDLPEVDRLKTLVVAGTNEARKSLNGKIRRFLDKNVEGFINTYENHDMTRAEHRLASSYQEGMILLVEKSQRQEQGLKLGQYYEVLGIDHDNNKLSLKSTETGDRQSIDPARAGNLSVYEKNRIEIAAGDWMRVTRNLKLHGINNGERYQVKSLHKDRNEIELSNGVVLSTKERLHLQYGYVTTVHSAQGLTEDRVMIEANTKSMTSNRAVYYVGISRPRYAETIYTDNKEKLPESMSRVPKKYAALDIRTEVSDAATVQRILQERRYRQEQRRKTNDSMRQAQPNSQKSRSRAL